jgi:esterase/lipase superfamily enzyme
MSGAEMQRQPVAAAPACLITYPAGNDAAKRVAGVVGDAFGSAIPGTAVAASEARALPRLHKLFETGAHVAIVMVVDEPPRDGPHKSIAELAVRRAAPVIVLALRDVVEHAAMWPVLRRDRPSNIRLRVLTASEIAGLDARSLGPMVEAFREYWRSGSFGNFASSPTIVEPPAASAEPATRVDKIRAEPLAASAGPVVRVENVRPAAEDRHASPARPGTAPVDRATTHFAERPVEDSPSSHDRDEGVPSVETSGSSRTVLKVWFGTDRQVMIHPGSAGVAFGSRRSEADDPLTLGMAKVSIPAIHRPGRIEQPRWWRLEFREDPKKHMVLTDVRTLGVDDFVTSAGPLEKAGLLFVHGFNVSFDEAALRTAQLAFDLKFDGLPLLYSWSSEGSAVDYAHDAATVDWATANLQRFLELVTEKLRLSTLHIVAHSMGNRAVTQVLANWQSSTARAPIAQVVLAAPDVDTGLFKQLTARFRGYRQVTLYASRSDRALGLSKALHAYPRAGDTDPPCVTPGVDTIDVTSAGAQMFGLGHGYVANASRVFTDLYYLVRLGLKPKDRISVRPSDDGTHYVLT